MKTPLDDHGQPLNGFYNRRRRIDRDTSELLGLAKGILADGILSDDEGRFLKTWAENHPDAIGQWPTSILFTRLGQCFLDGRIDDTERHELKELLDDLVCGKITVSLGYEGATSLPLDIPPPLVCYGPDEVFVFTGRFAYGPRTKCEFEVHERGAACENNITRKTTFLVIGTFASEDWAHTSYGRKIERAVELRTSGFPIRIVGEDHWASSLAAAAV